VLGDDVAAVFVMEMKVCGCSSVVVIIFIVVIIVVR